MVNELQKDEKGDCQNIDDTQGEESGKGVPEEMPQDTRYLTKYKNIWYFDYSLPSSIQKFFKKKRIRHTLNTSELKKARTLRDKYLIPVVTASTAIEIIENIKRYIDLTQIDLSKSTKALQMFMNRHNDESTVTLSKICDYYLSDYKNLNRAKASIEKVEASINAICAILDGNSDAEQITKEDIIRYRDTLLSLPNTWQRRKKLPGGHSDLTEAQDDETKMNPNYVNYEVKRIKAIFVKAIEDSKLSRIDNPADKVKVGKVSVQHKRPPEGHEVEALCSMKMPKTSKFDTEVWTMLPLFGRYTGCRVGEIAQITAADVVNRQSVLCLRITAHGEGKSLKNMSSERLVPVCDKLKPHLDKLLSVHSQGALFPHCGTWGVKHAHYFLTRYNQYAKQIATDLSFHCWRVYVNTQMANAGIDIIDREAIMGHKSDRTQRSYTPDNLKRWKGALDTVE